MIATFDECLVMNRIRGIRSCMGDLPLDFELGKAKMTREDVLNDPRFIKAWTSAPIDGKMKYARTNPVSKKWHRKLKKFKSVKKNPDAQDVFLKAKTGAPMTQEEAIFFFVFYRRRKRKATRRARKKRAGAYGVVKVVGTVVAAYFAGPALVASLATTAVKMDAQARAEKKARKVAEKQAIMAEQSDPTMIETSGPLVPVEVGGQSLETAAINAQKAGADEDEFTYIQLNQKVATEKQMNDAGKQDLLRQKALGPVSDRLVDTLTPAVVDRAFDSATKKGKAAAVPKRKVPMAVKVGLPVAGGLVLLIIGLKLAGKTGA